MNKKVVSGSRYKKKPYLILIAILIWGGLVVLAFWPWVHKFDIFDPTLSILAHISAWVWWIVLLWALHHLIFQLSSLFSKDAPEEGKNNDRLKIAVLYTTCDDFNNASCISCLEQNYKDFKVYICDDSKKSEYKNIVDDFFNEHHDKCELIRRPNNSGFKAGNLNYAIEHHVEEEWILLVDADQILPSSYISEFVEKLPHNDSEVAFIQAAQKSVFDSENGRGGSSLFQKALSPGISIFYFRDMDLRDSFGFVPLLGHGAMVRKTAWREVGKFPEIVSEDFGFALNVSNKRQRGRYLKDIISYEDFPVDFGSFMIRLKKFASGTAELTRSIVPKFFLGPAKLVEKWDFMMMLFWYIIAPFVVLNGFLGSFVTFRLCEEGLPFLHPVLPYLYTFMLFSIFALQVSVTEKLIAAIRFYFWSSAIYTAAMPLAGWLFLKHFFCKPVFNTTPKNKDEGKLSAIDSILMVILGLIAIILAIKWFSPFSPILAGQGIAYLSFPLYPKLNSDSFLGKVSRLLIILPGTLMLLGLVVVWLWTRA
jgi:glycosyltransferase involved in cell wall biosynthesis